MSDSLFDELEKVEDDDYTDALVEVDPENEIVETQKAASPPSQDSSGLRSHAPLFEPSRVPFVAGFGSFEENLACESIFDAVEEKEDEIYVVENGSTGEDGEGNHEQQNALSEVSGNGDANLQVQDCSTRFSSMFINGECKN